MIQSNTAPRRSDPCLNRLSRKVGYFVTIIVTAVMIVVVRMVPDWNFKFIVDAQFEDWIPYFVLSCGATILANMVLLGIDPYRLRHLMQIFTNIFSLISLLALISIYPFHFEDDTLDKVVHIVLWLGVLGICISFLSDGVKVLIGERENDRKAKKEKEKSKLKREMPI
ncbi:MAG: hypothetical protein HY862_11150 [Chloroflexi bacterium]|nr:hypothetical protein [Chloroflexota bacterium]